MESRVMPAPLDPICLFEVLAEHAVHYVLVGGTAAVLHESPTATFGADIVPSKDHGNLVRLSEALVDLEARIRTPDDPAGVAFQPHPELLASLTMLNTTTRCGNLDLAFAPTALGTYDDIAARSVRIDLDTVSHCGIAR